MPHSEPPKIPNSKECYTGKLTGMLAVLLALCLVASILLPAMHRAKYRIAGPVAQHAMKQLGLGFTMYAEESTGAMWPGLSPNQRVWAPDLAQIYPKYAEDPAILVSSEHPGRNEILTVIHYVLNAASPDHETAAGLMGLSFAYLGYAVKDQAGFAALVEARNRGLLDGSGKNIRVRDLDALIFPLREGVERFLITDINGASAFAQLEAIRSNIPVMVEIAGWKHKRSEETPRGAHVLYMGGHVEFVKLGTFPVVPGVMDVLSGLAEGIPATPTPAEPDAATAPQS